MSEFLEYSEQLHYIHIWKKKLTECQTNRQKLKDELLDILDNDGLDPKTRKENFDILRLKLLSSNHHQGFSWKPSSIFGFLARILPSIFSKNIQAGSRLYHVLSQDVCVDASPIDPVEALHAQQIKSDEHFCDALFDEPLKAIEDLNARTKNNQIDDVYFKRLHQARKRLPLPALERMILNAVRFKPREFYQFFNHYYQNKRLEPECFDITDNMFIEDMMQALLLSQQLTGNEITHIVNQQAKILLSLAMGQEPLSTPDDKVMDSAINHIKVWCEQNPQSSFKRLYENGMRKNDLLIKPYDNPVTILQDVYLTRLHEHQFLHYAYLRQLLIYLMLQTCAYPEKNDTRNSFISLIFKLGHQHRSFNLDAVSPTTDIEAKLDIASPARNKDGRYHLFSHAKHDAIHLMLYAMAYPDDKNGLLIIARTMANRGFKSYESNDERDIMIELFAHFYQTVKGDNPGVVRKIAHIAKHPPIQWDIDILTGTSCNANISLEDLWSDCHGFMDEGKYQEEQTCSKYLLIHLFKSLKESISSDDLIQLHSLFSEIEKHYCSKDLSEMFKIQFETSARNFIRNKITQCSNLSSFSEISQSFNQLSSLFSSKTEQDLKQSLSIKGYKLILKSLKDGHLSIGKIYQLFIALTNVNRVYRIETDAQVCHRAILLKAMSVFPKVDEFTQDHQIEYESNRLNAAIEYLNKINDADSIEAMTSDIQCACQAFDNALHHKQQDTKWVEKAHHVLNHLKPWISDDLYNKFSNKLPQAKASSCGFYAPDLPKARQQDTVPELPAQSPTHA